MCFPLAWKKNYLPKGIYLGNIFGEIKAGKNRIKTSQIFKFYLGLAHEWFSVIIFEEIGTLQHSFQLFRISRSTLYCLVEKTQDLDLDNVSNPGPIIS